jgi:hypothetical protein
VEYILNKLLPDDELNTDNDFHKFIREQVNEDMITPDDSDFTLPELNNIIKKKKQKPRLRDLTKSMIN